MSNWQINMYLFIIFLLASGKVLCQNLSEITFGSDSTFDVVTWNIEWFPKRGTATIDSVGKIIESLNADVIGLQEIDDTLVCRQMINNIPNYELFMDDDWFGGLAFVYNTNAVAVQSIYKIYDTQPFWNTFPRSPLVMELIYNQEEVVVINNHYKCCGDGVIDMGNNSDEEFRRFEANRLLKNYIDSNFYSRRVVLLGDLNDLITEPSPNNVFEMFLNDSNNYSFVDEDIANGSSIDWSYPNWPSHLDHILITNELFADFINSGSLAQTIKIDDFMSGGFDDYDFYISDHRPVGMKLKINSNPSHLLEGIESKINVFPNPTDGTCYLDLSQFNDQVEVTISNINGTMIQSSIYQGNQFVILNLDGPAGVYLISAKSNNETSIFKWIKK